MHNMKPNTDYVVVSVQVLVKKSDLESGYFYDGMSCVMDTALFEEDGSDGVVADWQYREEEANRVDWEHRTGDEPEEGEAFGSENPRA